MIQIIIAILLPILTFFYIKSLIPKKYHPTKGEVLVSKLLLKIYNGIRIDVYNYFHETTNPDYITFQNDGKGIGIVNTKNIKLCDDEINKLIGKKLIYQEIQPPSIPKPIYKLSKEFENKLSEHEGDYISYLKEEFYKNEIKNKTTISTILGNTIFPFMTILITIYTFLLNSTEKQVEKEIQNLNHKQELDSLYINGLENRVKYLENFSFSLSDTIPVKVIIKSDKSPSKK